MVNEIMRKSEQFPVMGQIAPGPKWTKASALLLASALALPVFVILSVVEWLWL